MDNRPVFVLTTSATCGPCSYFKQNVWPNLREKLESDNKVNIVHIEVPTQGVAPDPDKYHPAVRNFIGWYPTMSIFLASDWRNKKDEAKLRGIIKNGSIVKTTGKPDRVELEGDPDISEKSILEWVDYSLNNNKLFKNQDIQNHGQNHNQNQKSNTDSQNLKNKQNKQNNIDSMNQKRYEALNQIKVPTSGSYFKRN